MPLIGYTLEGADTMILDGRKTSTIRRGDATKLGQFLSFQARGRNIRHYMHPRSRSMKFIASTPIKSVQLFHFGSGAESIPEEIAEADGFDSRESMYEWFRQKYGAELPSLTFIRITWDPPSEVF